MQQLQHGFKDDLLHLVVTFISLSSWTIMHVERLFYNAYFVCLESQPQTKIISDNDIGIPHIYAEESSSLHVGIRSQLWLNEVVDFPYGLSVYIHVLV